MPVLGWIGRNGEYDGAAFGAEGGQDDLEHLVVTLQHADQRGVEASGGVVVGGRSEFILKSKRVQKSAQPGVIVRAETGVGAERIGNAGQRLAKVALQHLLVRDIVRDLAKSVHVVAERQQF